MHAALSVHSSEEMPRFCERMLLPGTDPFVFEEALSVGDHGDYRIEHVDDDLILVFGGRYAYTPSRAVNLHRLEDDWSAKIVIDRLGGPSIARLVPGNLPRLLAEYWPTCGFGLRKHGYLACLLRCAAYDTDFIVTASRGETGYILHLYPFSSEGRHDPNAYFALPD